MVLTLILVLMLMLMMMPSADDDNESSTCRVAVQDYYNDGDEDKDDDDGKGSTCRVAVQRDGVARLICCRLPPKTKPSSSSPTAAPLWSSSS